MEDHRVIHEDDLEEGSRVFIELEGREITVFNIEGEYHAFLNYCPHQSGPVCEGSLTGTVESSFDRESLETTTRWVKEGELLVCPWHRWEFDIADGECLSRDGVVLPKYPATVNDDGYIVVTI